ncbi:Small ubiquitin-related modifier, SUMO [Corchorus olitorius]|uniref:Small ubiquitin-related modifier, SUMO n=1 Tax=Corchorus olitorius TaxID=93759 RepID=A0A1R3KRZ4_9ROSI|nr:Small ubiquitin-related modifier, SUMO [Corchorus olitorius]
MVKPEPGENCTNITASTQSTLICLPRAQGEGHIILKVQRQGAAEQLSYQIGRNTPLRDLMLDFCDRTGLVFHCTRFLHPEGSRICPLQTANDLKLEDEDIIDAMNDQIGG